jgi:hypothetical protein
MPSSVYKRWWDQFSRTGSIAPVALGMARQQLAELFGAPDDHKAGVSVQRSPIWKYGSLEFHFDEDGSLNLIFMDTPEGVVISIPRLAR